MPTARMVPSRRPRLPRPVEGIVRLGKQLIEQGKVAAEKVKRGVQTIKKSLKH